MTRSRPTRPAAVPGLLVLASVMLAAPTRSAGDEFPPPADLPARAEMPDPLVAFDGAPVTGRGAWFGRRRPELGALFQHYMYGTMPGRPPGETFEVTRVDRGFLGGAATLKEVAVTLGPPGVPTLQLLVVVPNARRRPAPVFVATNFQGNHAVVNDPKVALPVSWVPGFFKGVKDNRATDAGRGAEVDVWAADDLVRRGYALATYYCGDVAPDRKGDAGGVIPHFLGPGRSTPGPHDWGAIAAWAWGLSRAVDYLATDPDIDGGRVAVTGWSRMGKAALVAAAFDDRVALAVPHQAGCGGSAPSRAKAGETVARINNGNPHWFAREFRNFNEHPERLPFDQNCLVAMVAPRAVLFTNATLDTGANPEGQFQVLRAAEPVYSLLGAAGLGADAMPPVNTLVGRSLAFHIRPGTHSLGREDWAVFLDHADALFGKPGSR